MGLSSQLRANCVVHVSYMQPRTGNFSDSSSRPNDSAEALVGATMNNLRGVYDGGER